MMSQRMLFERAKSLFGAYVDDYEKYVEEYFEKNEIDVFAILPNEEADKLIEYIGEKKDLDFADIEEELDKMPNVVKNEELLTELTFGLTYLHMLEDLMIMVREECVKRILQEVAIQEKKEVLKRYLTLSTKLIMFRNNDLSRLFGENLLNLDYMFLANYQMGKAKRIRLEDIGVELQRFMDCVKGQDFNHVILLFSDWRLQTTTNKQNEDVISSCIQTLLSIIKGNCLHQAMLKKEIKELELNMSPNLGDSLEYIIGILEKCINRMNNLLKEFPEFEHLKKNIYKDGKYLTSDDISYNVDEFNEIKVEYSEKMIYEYYVFQDMIKAAYASLEVLRWLVEIVEKLKSSAYIELTRKLKLIVSESLVDRLKILHIKMLNIVYSDYGKNEYDKKVNGIKLKIIEIYEEKIEITHKQLEHFLELIETVNKKDISSYFYVKDKLIQDLPKDVSSRMQEKIEQALFDLYMDLKESVKAQEEYPFYQGKIEEHGLIKEFRNVVSDNFISTLATAEVLFFRFCSKDEGINYSFIMLAYLECMEILLNDVFYRPYLNAIISEEKDNIIEKNEQFYSWVGPKPKEFFKKYFGTKIVINKKGVDIPKRLELGKFSFILKYFAEVEKYKKFVLSKYPNCNYVYLSEVGERIVDCYSVDRNNTAHGSKLYEIADAKSVKEKIFPIEGQGGELLRLLSNL